MPVKPLIEYEWDQNKSEQTRKRRGFGFEIALELYWDFALCVEEQFEGAEVREKWVGPINDHLYVLVTTPRESRIRIVSLRRATQREIEFWRQNISL